MKAEETGLTLRLIRGDMMKENIEQADRGVAEFVIRIKDGECCMIIHAGTYAEETVACARGRHYTPLFDFCKTHLQLLGINRKLAVLDKKKKR